MNGNLVYYDETTGCYSRYYYDNIVKVKYDSQECYLIYVDINNLKSVNDRFGHHEGTKLIKRVSKELLSLSNIKYVCRVGGDEFVAVATKEFDFNQLKQISDISFGIYLKSVNENVVSACKKADNNMYIMKQKLKRITNN